MRAFVGVLGGLLVFLSLMTTFFYVAGEAWTRSHGLRHMPRAPIGFRGTNCQSISRDGT